jgi:hypothetical protein
MMPDLADFDFAPGPLQLTQSRIDDITLQEDNFDTRSLRDHNFLNDDLSDFGDAESNFDEEFERTRRNFEMIQQSSHGSGGRGLLAHFHTPLMTLDMELQRRSVSYMEDDHQGHSLPNNFDDDDYALGVNDDELQDLENLINENMETDENNHIVPESISLDPLMDENLQNERATRQKRRRKLVVDDVTTISGEEMKLNMADYRSVTSFEEKFHE